LIFGPGTWDLCRHRSGQPDHTGAARPLIRSTHGLIDPRPRLMSPDELGDLPDAGPLAPFPSTPSFRERSTAVNEPEIGTVRALTRTTSVNIAGMTCRACEVRVGERPRSTRPTAADHRRQPHTMGTYACRARPFLMALDLNVPHLT
jgi:hypothetical protein